ncbi:MAG: Hint domain-containing protein [Nioella sp.]
MGWLAIWDGRRLTHLDRHARDADLSQGTVRFEMSLRGEVQVPVILWQGRTGTPRDLRILCRPDGVISLEHGGLLFESDPGFVYAGEPIVLHYSWDREGRADLLSMTNSQTGAHLTLRPGCHAPRHLSEIVPETPGRAVSVAYAGLANHPLPPHPLPGLSGTTRLQIPGGTRPVEALKPGMEVLTAGGKPETIRWIGTTEHMARGICAPILLRAPYFGLDNDILVSRSQRLCLSGCEVDYLFGVEKVLAKVDDIRRANSAQIDLSSPTFTSYHLLLDDHECLLSGRCALDSNLLGEVLEACGKSTATLAGEDLAPAWPVIDRAGAQAYLDMLSQNRPAAA